MTQTRSPRSRLQQSTRKLLAVGPGGYHRAISETLQTFAWLVESTATVGEAAPLVEQASVILIEAALPDGTWRDLLSLSRQSEPAPPVIVVSRIADERLWAEVLNLGAYDLLPLPLEPGSLLRTLESAYREFASGQPANPPRRQVQKAHPDSVAAVAGS